MRNKPSLSLLSALLLSSAWLGFTGLPLLAGLVPLLAISGAGDGSRRSFRSVAGWTALTIALWHAADLWWIWYAAPIGTVAAVIIGVLLFGGVFMLFHYIRFRAGRALAYTVLVCGWVAAEWFYTGAEISFPWLTLGNGFARDAWAVQWYEYTGVFGGSLWILLCNVSIYEALRTRGRAATAAAVSAVCVPLLVSGIIYLTYKPSEAAEALVTVVQPNIDPYEEKFVMSQRAQDSVLLAVASAAPAGVDFIIMPETALHSGMWEEDISDNPAVKAFRRFLAENHPGAKIIVGAETFRKYASPEAASETARSHPAGYLYDVYNSALGIDTSGTVDIYHKSKLVVGVEKMPYARFFKPLENLVVDLGGTTGGLGSDDRRSVFPYSLSEETVSVGVPICYESVYGEYFSEFVRLGAGFIAVITNDGWWGDTPGYRQHFSYSRLRAVETRRWIARSANTGISGFISPRGDAVETLGWDVRGAATRNIALGAGLTFYVRYGDYIGRICGYVFVLSVLYYVAYRYRRRSHLVD